MRRFRGFGLQGFRALGVRGLGVRGLRVEGSECLRLRVGRLKNTVYKP